MNFVLQKKTGDISFKPDLASSTLKEIFVMLLVLFYKYAQLFPFGL